MMNGILQIIVLQRGKGGEVVAGMCHSESGFNVKYAISRPVYMQYCSKAINSEILNSGKFSSLNRCLSIYYILFVILNCHIDTSYKVSETSDLILLFLLWQWARQGRDVTSSSPPVNDL